MKEFCPVVGFGPRGGDLAVPHQNGKAEWRRADFNGEELPMGGLGLHRFDKESDSAVAGTKNEKPWHRMAAYMLNAGRTNKEIAAAAGVSEQSVSNLRAQRWFQEICAAIANSEGEDVLGLLRSEAKASIEKLVDLRDYSESDRVQLTAATTLLEHAHGKAVQKTISVVGHSQLRPADEKAAIEAELAMLRQVSPDKKEKQNGSTNSSIPVT